MTAQGGEYIYLVGVVALGIGLAIYARYDYQKRKIKRIKGVKDEDRGAPSQVRARTVGRQETPFKEVLREGRDGRAMQQASLESRSLTREEKKELYDAIAGEGGGTTRALRKAAERSLYGLGADRSRIFNDVGHQGTDGLGWGMMRSYGS